MKTKSLFILLLTLKFIPAFSQTNSVIIGTLVKNINESEINKDNPYVVIPLFQKTENIWKEYDHSEFHSEIIDFIVSKNNKNYGVIKTQFDTSIDRLPYIISSYKTISPLPSLNIISQFTLSAFPSDSMFNNSVLCNQNFYFQRNQIKKRKCFRSDSLMIYQYLKSQAKLKNLGNLSSRVEETIGKMYNIYYLSKDFYLIETDIKLNMYCYSDNVPFANDSSHLWNSTEKFSISSRSFTPRAFFTVKNGIVKYIDYSLNLITSGDYDNDGYDELIFNFTKYNKDGFILVMTKNNEPVNSTWSYH